MAVAMTKIEYRSTRTGKSVILVPGQEVPDDMSPSDVEELTKWGAIGSAEDHERATAIAEAERDAAIARAAAADAETKVRQIRGDDAGTGEDTVR